MSLKEKIHTVRNKHIMLDRDLAELYGVETRVLNQAVRRNKERFPEHFMFQLTKEEFESYKQVIWKSQFVISNNEKMGLRKRPYAFTELGVAMLSAVLKSKTAILVSVEIMEAFVAMRHFHLQNKQLFQRMTSAEFKLIEHEKNIKRLFTAMESKPPEKGIFFEGQVFDAYSFVSNLIAGAQDSITLVDNYVDTSVFTILAKKKAQVKVSLYTAQLSKQLALDQKKFNQQYGSLEIKEFTKSHDRFLIIDDKTYHLGASLKDLGKKWFAFSVFDKESLKIITKLQKET